MLDRVLPLGVIEASHFLAAWSGGRAAGAFAGAARRLDAAYLPDGDRDASSASRPRC